MFKSKLTPIIAVAALVVAVLGTTPLGQAASGLVLPKNSVGAAQLKKHGGSGQKHAGKDRSGAKNPPGNPVGGPKIAPDAVTGAKVEDGSLLSADLAPGQLPAGAKGPSGAA